jgi:hypothetical protein
MRVMSPLARTCWERREFRLLPCDGPPCLVERFISRDSAILLFVAKAQSRKLLEDGRAPTSDRLKVNGLLRLFMLRRAHNVAAAIESPLGLFLQGGFEGLYTAAGELEAEEGPMLFTTLDLTAKKGQN